MRTTVNLDDETYYLLSNYAQGKGITLGAAVGEVTRKGLEGDKTRPSRLKRLPNGMLVLAGRGRPLTDEMVKAALEEVD
ncbi:MAG TPA: hypothetical protein VF392_07205 [Terracidiphilus sp.]